MARRSIVMLLAALFAFAGPGAPAQARPPARPVVLLTQRGRPAFASDIAVRDRLAARRFDVALADQASDRLSPRRPRSS